MIHFPQDSKHFFKICHTDVNIMQTFCEESEWQSTQRELKSLCYNASPSEVLQCNCEERKKTLGIASGRRWNTRGFHGAGECTQPGGGQRVGDLKETKNLNRWQTRQPERRGALQVALHFHPFQMARPCHEKHNRRRFKRAAAALLWCVMLRDYHNVHLETLQAGWR